MPLKYQIGRLLTSINTRIEKKFFKDIWVTFKIRILGIKSIYQGNLDTVQ